MQSIDIHERYEIVRERLSLLSSSPRNQLYQIAAWIDVCTAECEPSRLRSYVREIGSLLFPIAGSVDAACLPPAYFASLRTGVAWIASSFPGMFDPSEISRCIERLAGFEAAAWSFLGVPEQGHDAAIASSFRAAVDDGSTERDTVEQFVRALELHASPLYERYADIARNWDAAIRSAPDLVRIPVIEQDITRGAVADFQPFVSIATLRLHMHHAPGASGDVFDLTHLSYANGGERDEFEAASTAARALADATMRSRLPGAQHVLVSAGDSRVQITGRSFGLGFALGLFSMLSRQSADSRYYAADGATAFTGRIDADGAVRRIDADQIAIKSRALWHSPCARLLLPKENETDAESAVKPLRDAFRRRAFDIVPARHLRDAFNHRQVIRTEVLTVRRRVIRAFVRHQTALAAGSLAMLVLGVSAYFLLLADFDRNPHDVLMSDNLFQVRNRNGKILWRQPIYPPEAPASNALVHCWKAPRFAVFDLDGDGKNEVLLAHGGHKRFFSDVLECYAADGSCKWPMRLTEALVTGEGQYLSDEGFEVQGVAVIPRIGMEEPRIVVTACNQFYTNIVRIVDIRGKTLSQYLHLGNLADLHVITDSLHHSCRILLTGASNPFIKPAAIILDPDHIAGISPSTDRYRVTLPVLPPGTEEYYLLFPEPDVDKTSGNSRTAQISVLSADDGHVVIEPHYGSLPTVDEDGVPDQVALFYTFRTDTMSPLSVQTSSQFDALHASLKRSGRISSTLDYAYKQALMDGILYWNGNAFVQTPVRNARYDAAVLAATGASSTPK